MQEFFKDPGELLPFLAVGGGLLVAIVAIVFGTISSVMRTEKVERSRREIAAYIAEGSMTPEEGERLLKAGQGGVKA